MEGPVCKSRYCDTGTLIIDDELYDQGNGRQGSKSSDEVVVPTKYIEEYTIKEKQIPKKMDQLVLRREHTDRRQYNRDMVAKNALSKGQIVRSDNPQITQMQLQVILQKLRDQGVNYKNVSDYFESTIRSSAASREYKAIAAEMFVKDRDQLRDSAACYAAVISRLQTSRGLPGLVDFSQAVSDLSSVLGSK